MKWCSSALSRLAAAVVFFTRYKDAVALYKELKEENDVAYIQVNNVATGKTNLEYMSKEYYV